MKSIILIALLCLLAGGAAATEALPNAQDEARAVSIGNTLRCVVCQSESINDSQADMARDLRQLVRDKIRAGWSDEQIFTYARERYGDFILLKPPVQTNTGLLWLSPVLFLVIAGGIGFTLLRRAPTTRSTK